MNQYEAGHDLANRPASLRAEHDAGVRPSLLVQAQEVAVVRNDGASVTEGSCQVIGVRRAAETGFDRRNGIDPASPKLRRDRRGNVLVQQEARLSHAGRT